MKTIITYGSIYGNSRRYAEKLSEDLNIQAVSYKDIDFLKDYDRVIHIGSLYGGMVKGLKKVIKKMKPTADFHLATVGLTDVKIKENNERVERALKNQIPPEILNKAHIYFLRGGIFYDKLSFTHKLMMKVLCKKLSSIPEKERSAGVKDLLSTYNQNIDFVDFSLLEDLENKIR